MEVSVRRRSTAQVSSRRVSAGSAGSDAARHAEPLETRLLLTTYYVNTNSASASDSNAGTSIKFPFKTITQALTIVSDDTSGKSDKILILAGTYHEEPTVWPGDSGVSAVSPTVISAYVNPANGQYQPVYVDAADPTTGAWTEVGNSPVWYLSNFTTETSGLWVDWSGSNDGPSLQQIGTYNDGYFDQRTIVGSNVSSMYAGTYYGDIADSRLYVWLGDGSDPDSHVIEYASRANAIYQAGAPVSGGYVYADNIDFDGLNLRHDNAYSTFGQSPGCAVFTENNDVLLNCNIQGSGEMGVLLYGDAQLINCISSNNGGNGVAAQGSGFLISGGQYDSNYFREYTDGSNAGIKVISNVPTLYGNIENAQVENNLGQGIWFDTCFENSVVSQIMGNQVLDNQGAGIDLEASRHFLVANNVIVGNQADGITLNAVEDAQVYNNTIVGNYGTAAVELDGDVRSQGNAYPGEIGMLNNSIDNNIIVNNYTVYDLDVPVIGEGTSEDSNNTADYNLYYRFGGQLHFTTGGSYLGSWGSTPATLAGWQSVSGVDSDSMMADPLFLYGGIGVASYQPGSNSPAIGAGLNLAAFFTTDNAGHARPSVGGYAIGAFEYSSGGPGTPGSIITNTDPAVWVDDELPDNAAMTEPDASGNQDENKLWYWSSSNAYSGAASLDSLPAPGAHRQYFTGANPRLIGINDRLIAYVYVDPTSPPQEIMLEWQDSNGSWAHQAYWGANLISGGVDGSVAGQYEGVLPSVGGWALLAVPAVAVGLAGVGITGFSFDLYGGGAQLDKIGNAPAPAVVPTLNIDSGTYVFGINPRTDYSGLIVNVGSGATVEFETLPGSGITEYNLAAVNLAVGATAILQQSDTSADRSVLVLSTLSMSGSAASPASLVNVGNNDLIIHNGSASNLTQWLSSGYDSGTWAGTAGIVSTAAMKDPNHLTAIGLATGMSQMFDGIATSATDVEMKYTYYGDANLDGKVDGSDYSLIDNGMLARATGWYNGDFNYDGVVNGSDYTLIDNSFNRQAASLAAQVVTPDDATTAAVLIRREYVVTDPAMAGTESHMLTVPRSERLGLNNLVKEIVDAAIPALEFRPMVAMLARHRARTWLLCSSDELRTWHLTDGRDICLRFPQVTM